MEGTEGRGMVKVEKVWGEAIEDRVPDILPPEGIADPPKDKV